MWSACCLLEASCLPFLSLRRRAVPCLPCAPTPAKPNPKGIVGKPCCAGLPAHFFSLTRPIATQDEPRPKDAHRFATKYTPKESTPQTYPEGNCGNCTPRREL
uniref:Uncharacterized protein n=1 Tax=Caulerpa lentillifera TaxID=148947 RepID=A0A2Z2QKK7_9CHLO|nr:hypothetical protein [Caulerpa lentillifera]AST24274.1 hypothetical protein [Caulerpa lentillifera]